MGKRIGRFAMCRQLVERDPETARAVMGRCIVVRCEMMYEHDTFEYLAISPDFDEVPQGMIAPEYDVIISDGGKRIEFKRSNVLLTGERRRCESGAADSWAVLLQLSGLLKIKRGIAEADTKRVCLSRLDINCRLNKCTAKAY